MIMIDSKAGQRLARARASELEALRHYSKYPNSDNDLVLEKACMATRAAASALGDELMAGGHHLAEDYT